MNSRGSKTPGNAATDTFYPAGVAPSLVNPSASQNSLRRFSRLLLQLLAFAVILTTLIIGNTACGTLVTDIGPRGDAHLYAQSGGFIMGPPPFRLDLNPVPLSERRTYSLTTKDLSPSTFSQFSLEVRTRGLRALKPRFSDPAATSPENPDNPIVRIRILNEKGRQVLQRTIGVPEYPWRFEPSKWRTPVLTCGLTRFTGTPEKPTLPTDNISNITVIVEVLQSSAIPGRFLHISTSDVH